MSRRNERRKHGTTRGSLRRVRTARASRISREAMKSRRACEWGGWGRISVDGPRQNNSDRSEGPWGRAAGAARTVVLKRATCLGAVRGVRRSKRRARRTEANRPTRRFAPKGKAPSDIPALKPYWGKPAVRNFRGGGGNVGIIRSPLPRHHLTRPTHSGPESCGASRKGSGEALTGVPSSVG
jgi:hypothetical protein